MKILLANPPAKIDEGGGRERVYVRAGSRWPFSYVKKRGEVPGYYVPFPFFLAYAAALLEEDGHEVQAIDAFPLDLSEEEFWQQVKRIAPEVMVVETSTPTFQRDLSLLKKIKKTIDPLIVLVGPHVSTFPEETLRRYQQVDYVVAGEYEIKVRDLVRSLASLIGEGADNLPDTGGRKNGQIFFRRAGEIIKNLNQLPYPARHLFPGMGKYDLNCYWDNICPVRPCIQIHSSRGCNQHCDFCLWNQVIYNEIGYRCFTPARVVDEIEFLIQRYHPAAFYFDDDSFTISRDHVVNICSEILNRRLKIKWGCMADVAGLNPELLSLMARAGCQAIKFGVETADPRLLRLNRKNVPLEKIAGMVAEAKRLGIRTHATFCLGLYGETRDTLARTFRFAAGLKTDSVQCSIGVPYPGTRFYKKVEKGDHLIAEDWEEYDGRRSVISLEGIKPSELECLRRRLVLYWLRHRLVSLNWVERQIKFLPGFLKNQGVTATIRWLKALWRAV